MDDMGTDSSHSTHSSSSSMMMSSTFITSTNTPLYSTAWTPASTAGYAGTCIFLVALAVVFRAVQALKHVVEARWLDHQLARRYIVVAGREPLAQRLAADPAAKHSVYVSEHGAEENVELVQRTDGGRGASRPWRWSVDAPRAVLDVVLAGVGYLLMLAVMTLNVGYFLSVLAGVFLGSLAFGRFSVTATH